MGNTEGEIVENTEGRKGDIISVAGADVVTPTQEDVESVWEAFSVIMSDAPQSGMYPRSMAGLVSKRKLLIQTERSGCLEFIGVKNFTPATPATLNALMGFAVGVQKRRWVGENPAQVLDERYTDEGLTSYGVGGATETLKDILASDGRELDFLPLSLGGKRKYDGDDGVPLVKPRVMQNSSGQWVNYYGTLVVVKERDLVRAVYGPDGDTRHCRELLEQQIATLNGVMIKRTGIPFLEEETRRNGGAVVNLDPLVCSRRLQIPTGKKGREAYSSVYVVYFSPLLNIDVNKAYIKDYPYREIAGAKMTQSDLPICLTSAIVSNQPVTKRYNGSARDLLVKELGKSPSHISRESANLKTALEKLREAGAVEYYRYSGKNVTIQISSTQKRKGKGQNVQKKAEKSDD